MKKSILFFCLLGVAFLTRAQGNIDKTIQLKDSTIEYSVTLKITKAIKEVNFAVIGFLSNGELSFKIADPEGKKEGGFGLVAMDDDGKIQPGSGRMTHSVKVPIPGTWTVKIKTVNATGNLTYKINFKQL